MAKCALCGCDMQQERIELGLYHCRNCNKQQRPKGVMEYTHKTGGVLVITDEEGFKELKKTASERR